MTSTGEGALEFRREVESVSSGEASGKPWIPLIRAEDRARFDAKVRDLDMEFLDRNGEPMRPSDWLEARGDLDYVLVDADQLGDIAIGTTWVGVHLPDNPGWDRVVFGSQVVDLAPGTLARMASQPATEKRPEEPFDLLGLLDPRLGQLVYRASFRTLSEAERGHQFVAGVVAAAKIGSEPSS
jgi:hypothetical protein